MDEKEKEFADAICKATTDHCAREVAQVCMTISAQGKKSEEEFNDMFSSCMTVVAELFRKEKIIFKNAEKKYDLANRGVKL